MGVWKIKPQDWSSLKSTPKELTHFWRSYFSNLSIEFSKLYFKLTREYARIQMTNRECMRARDYFANLEQSEILKSFIILPHGELAFIHLPKNMAKYLINRLLGAQDHSDYEQGHELTQTDQKLLENIVLDKIKIIKSQFFDDYREIEIQLLSENDTLLSANSLRSEQVISVQYFSYQIGDQSFIFSVAIANRLLEQFVLI